MSKQAKPVSGKLANPVRRLFMSGSLGVACAAGMVGAGLASYGTQVQSAPADALRPPGALPEADFLSACVRCGLCVRDCPYDTLKLAPLGAGLGVGTPYFKARHIPCEMCSDIPCLQHCPTGALDPRLSDINQARMGLAVLLDQETCLNFLGLRCDVCYRVCPAIDEAITLEKQRNPRSDRHGMLLPTVHSAHCTGCGKCEHACVLEEAAIKVLPLAQAKGKLGAHYRLGWEQKAGNHGQSLLGEDMVELPVRGLETSAGSTWTPPPLDGEWKP
ncbi:ferredoxin-type protein NapG [Aquitalea sp. S1-19]|nr:ferredoxin-type protein NapG [Aquitalea sp. S1-19]